MRVRGLVVFVYLCPLWLISIKRKLNNIRHWLVRKQENEADPGVPYHSLTLRNMIGVYLVIPTFDTPEDLDPIQDFFSDNDDLQDDADDNDFPNETTSGTDDDLLCLENDSFLFQKVLGVLYIIRM